MFSELSLLTRVSKYIDETVHERENKLTHRCYSEQNPEACHLLANMKAHYMKFQEAVDVYKANCDLNNYGKSCTKYASHKIDGLGCKIDVEVAYEYMLKGCEQKDPHGCYQAGRFAMNQGASEYPVNRMQKGMELLDEACSKYKVAPACYELYRLYYNGKDGYVDKDVKKATEMLHINCDNNDVDACNMLSEMYAKGNGVEQDLELAEKYKKRFLKRRR